MNYWDELMGTDEGAANYMETYGEGPGCETRHIVGSFINDGETVLDVGCGPGWNLDHFIQYGPKISEYKGLDYSERFVRVANERWERRSEEGLNPGDGIPFYLGDCRKLMQPDNFYDVVILQDVLEYTNGYEKPIQEALRVASKRVIICIWRNLTVEPDKTNDDGNDGYGSDYQESKFLKFLDDLGYHWMETETSPAANRWHRYFIIDKEEQHG
jgi:ubiquinone/menaquinone biosynthesis C-methylase UbiE